MKTLAIFLLSCFTLSAQVGFRSAPFVAAVMKPTVGVSAFDCNVWQTFEFDGTVDGTALATTDHGTATWSVVDTETKLSTTASGENPTVSMVKGGGDADYASDTGSRGIGAAIGATTTSGRFFVGLGNVDYASVGFWIKVPQWTANRNILVFRFDLNATAKMSSLAKLTTGNVTLSMSVASSEEITIAADTWYWVTFKYTKSGTCSGKLYTSSGALHGSFADQTDTSGSQINYATFGLISIGSAEALSIYFDDVCVVVGTSLFPVGP